MIKAKIIYTMIIACSIIILIGVGLTWYFIVTPDRHDVIDVNIDVDGSSESIEFDAIDLIPGRSVGYTVRLYGKVKGDYDVTLSFKDDNEELTLKNYVYVKITVGEEILCDKLLSEVFEENYEIEFSCVLDTKDTYDMSVVYYMPDTVGNEAQGTKADFRLNIVASNAEGFYE